MPGRSRPCENPCPRAASRRRGFTFVELLVVATVLLVLAGLVLFRAGDVSSKSREDVALISMGVLRDAICGTDHAPGFKTDLGEVPAVLADLLRKPDRTMSGKQVDRFDPRTGRGWNGPYLMRPTGSYLVDPQHGFTEQYGAMNEPAMLDPWGHPIVVQWPMVPGLNLREREVHVRLVSAGPDGVLDTSSKGLKPNMGDAHQAGDDVLVYLFPDTRP